jgi:IS5 family transposase
MLSGPGRPAGLQGEDIKAGMADIARAQRLDHGLERWGIRYRINRRPTARRPLSERWRMINRARSRTRACGEHAFRVVKQLGGFTKVRYRGLAKNLARAQTMFALANLYQVRHQLLPAGMRCSL